jgi:hypothetical protein
VQHERQPFGRRERVEHDEQGQAYRVGEQRLVLGGRAVRAVHDRVGQLQVHQLLSPRRARAQHVERHARYDGGQPAA